MLYRRACAQLNPSVYQSLGRTSEILHTRGTCTIMYLNGLTVPRAYCARVNFVCKSVFVRVDRVFRSNRFPLKLLLVAEFRKSFGIPLTVCQPPVFTVPTIRDSLSARRFTNVNSRTRYRLSEYEPNACVYIYIYTSIRHEWNRTFEGTRFNIGEPRTAVIVRGRS